MTRLLTKREAELRVFEPLAPLVPLDVVAGSISQPHEPHPDIRCEIRGPGSLAVELVALDADSTQLRLSNMLRTDEAWNIALARWPSSERKRIEVPSKHRTIGLNLSEQAGVRDRAELFGAVQRQLLRRPPDYEGNLFDSELDLPEGLHGVRVYALASGQGPRLIAPSTGSLQRTNVGKLRTKLTAKRYDAWGAPIDLFAYTAHDSIHETGALPDIIEAVAQYLPSSPFQNVHVLDFARGRLEYSTARR